MKRRWEMPNWNHCITVKEKPQFLGQLLGRPNGINASTARQDVRCSDTIHGRYARVLQHRHFTAAAPLWEALVSALHSDTPHIAE
jgi:hypothetical protein